MSKPEKKKKSSLIKRIGIKLFKKVVLVTSKKQAKDLKSEKLEEFKVYAELIKEIIRPKPIEYTNTPNVAWIGQDSDNTDVYFYDFLKEWNNGGRFTTNDMIAILPNGNDGADDAENNHPIVAIDESIEKKEPKLKLKPIEVFGELERIPTPLTLENLEEKIAMFKMKEKFIKSNNYAKKEVIDFKLRLENRRKYNDFKDFFGKFECTTSQKINSLVSKYDLVLNTTDLFIATFPDEAIKRMNAYEEKTLELCGKKPIFYVIAEAKDFKKKYERNDPILLAQSPFGIYWDIIGVWDKEILLLEEL